METFTYNKRDLALFLWTIGYTFLSGEHIEKVKITKLLLEMVGEIVDSDEAKTREMISSFFGVDDNLNKIEKK